MIVDTTVMPKAIAHPTDSRLLDKSRQHLVKVAEDNGLRLRQNYNRVAPRLAAQIARYAHAKQFKCSHASMLPLHRPITRRVSALCCRDPVERISCQLHSGLVLPWMPQFLHKLIPGSHLMPATPRFFWLMWSLRMGTRVCTLASKLCRHIASNFFNAFSFR